MLNLRNVSSASIKPHRDSCLSSLVFITPLSSLSIKLIKCNKLTFIIFHPVGPHANPGSPDTHMWTCLAIRFCAQKVERLKFQTKNGELQIFYLWHKDAPSIFEDRQFRPSLADVIWELRSCRWIFSGPCQSCANGTPLRPFFQLVGKGWQRDHGEICGWYTLVHMEESIRPEPTIIINKYQSYSINQSSVFVDAPWLLEDRLRLPAVGFGTCWDAGSAVTFADMGITHHGFQWLLCSGDPNIRSQWIKPKNDNFPATIFRFHVWCGRTLRLSLRTARRFTF